MKYPTSIPNTKLNPAFCKNGAIEKISGNTFSYVYTNHLGNVMTVVSDKKTFHCSNELMMNADFNSGYNNIYAVAPVSNTTMSLSGNKLNVSSTSSSQSKAAGILAKECKPGMHYKVDFDLTIGGSISNVAVELYSNYKSPDNGARQDVHNFTSTGHQSYIVQAHNGLSWIKFIGTNSAASTFSIDNLVIKEAEADSQFYNAEIISATDYSPFGAPLPERTYQLKNEPIVKLISIDTFNLGTNGWIADGSHTTISSFYGNLNALMTSRGSAGEGMLKYFFTVPGTSYKIKFKLNTRGWPMLYVCDSINHDTLAKSRDILPPGEYEYTFTASGYSTQVRFHEIVLTNNDISLLYFRLEEVEKRDGVAFGMNGQMKDDEIAGPGNIMNAQFWEYDSRLGRRWNMDPKPTVGLSDYSVLNNNPISLLAY